MTEQPSRFKKIRNWYGRWERPISSLSLIGGFVFDAVFLKRVDLFWENFWVVVHIVLVGTCIVLIHAIEKEEGAEANPSKLHFWLVNVQQFFYGGIWSVFLVFYFRSSDISVSWPFLLILALSFIANERLKRHFVRFTFQISLFFLAIFCFAIFLIPVLLHRIGEGMFILSGAVSLVFISLFLWIIWLVSKKQFKSNKKLLFASIAGVFLLVNLLYFFNFIPPIPLSIKDAGVYHSIYRNAQGDYDVTTEPQGWKKFVTLYQDYHKTPGEPVYVYTAVFSPPEFKMDIIHEWQHQDPQTKQWMTQIRVTLHVVGGRDEGFRTYSLKSNPEAGYWRVNVLTTSGQLIGRVRFNVIAVNHKPNTIKEVNN